MDFCIVTLFALLIGQVSSMSLERRAIDGSLRLVGGRDNSVGRLEVYYKGTWGTVCDDNFDSVAATVACRDLGIPGGMKMQSWQFGPSNGPVLISDVTCTGAESRLTQCRFTGWGNTNCGSHENVGVRCGVSPSNSRLNTAGGNRYGGTGTSGSHYSSSGSGTTYNSGGNRYHSSSSSSTHYTHSNTNRGGSMGSSVNVPRPGGPSGSSGPSGPTIFQGPVGEGSVRLAEGKNPTQGRLEIFHNGLWGTVCKDGFDDMDAAVVCRQLGLNGGMAKPPSWFGPGLGKIWMTRALCDGHEGRVTECPYKGWEVHECQHTEDVGVECFSSHTRG